ncbi:cytochrome P450 71B34-like, partial [Jatropha curcas]|uniref:cytochrome P450 71B34-like n=1 Tax=Jatropha curcas TaxID=180498 RepID=UPI0018930247
FTLTLNNSEFWLEFDTVRIIQFNIIYQDIFLAGVDTGAVVMVWAMTELVRNPRVMRKAQEEIRSLIGEKIKVSESDTDKFIYLKSVLKETMRLHPPVPLLLPREAISQFNINDYEIHPKTRIQVNVWAIGKDPKIWKNPEEFIPERFIDNSIDFRGQNYEFLPFGGGRRSCPGITMGLALVELALANLLFCFDWELPYNMKEADINMEEKFGLTNHKKEALMLVPIKYHHLLYNKE